VKLEDLEGFGEEMMKLDEGDGEIMKGTKKSGGRKINQNCFF